MGKRSALGKGLSSLMGEANLEAGTTADSLIELSRIVPNKNQPRKNFDEEELEELTDSIRQNGVLQPILVRQRGSKYEIVAGERRYQAAKRAGLDEIPALVREVSDEEIFKLALIENLQRSDLDPIEEARGFRKLIEDNDFTQAELAQVLSKSRPAIANSLRLLDLPERVQSLLEDGLLTAGHARAILAVPSEDGRIRLAEKVVSDSLTVRQTENLAPLFSVTNDEPKRREPAPQYFKRAARQLRQSLNTNVKVHRVRNRNKIEIEFADEEELSRIIDRLSQPAEEE